MGLVDCEVQLFRGGLCDLLVRNAKVLGHLNEASAVSWFGRWSLDRFDRLREGAVRIARLGGGFSLSFGLCFDWEGVLFREEVRVPVFVGRGQLFLGVEVDYRNCFRRIVKLHFIWPSPGLEKNR